MKRSLALTLLLVAATGAYVLATGCGKNNATTVLTPTGIRPAPDVWPGALTGSVFFDPTLTPELQNPPFPPTRVELYSGANLVAVDSLAPTSREFHFANLAQGAYSVVARSRVFDAASRGNLPVRDEDLDIGNLTLRLNTSALEVAIYVIGTMPGFDADQIAFQSTLLGNNGYGVWTYPSDLSLPIDIAAGTYRFKFVTDESSTNANLIGWGGNPADTLQVPVTDHPATFGSGPATDLVAHFPVSGLYVFTLDERRQTYSIALQPPSPARARRLP